MISTYALVKNRLTSENSSKAFNDRQNLNQKLEGDLAKLSRSCEALQQSIENARVNRSSSDRTQTLQTYRQLLAQNQELDKKLEVIAS